MQIVTGIKVKVCWEVVNIHPHDLNTDVVFGFEVLIDGEHRFQGNAMKDGKIILENLTPDGIPIHIEVGEDHAVRRDLVSLGYVEPFSRYLTLEGR